MIDFEYASANTPGFEFANHFVSVVTFRHSQPGFSLSLSLSLALALSFPAFLTKKQQTEWCYNYHDSVRPWACNVRSYPKLEDQHRFISAYVKHKPDVSVASPLNTPHMHAVSSITPRLAPLDLDADVSANPGLPTSNDGENVRDESAEADVQFLMGQARLWRVFNSAQWAAWGVVQAKIPGMEEGIAAKAAAAAAETGQPVTNGEQETSKTTPAEPSSSTEVDESGDDEFDYLAYAQDRILFFWADLLALGLVKESQLPDELVERAKRRILDY